MDFIDYIQVHALFTCMYYTIATTKYVSSPIPEKITKNNMGIIGNDIYMQMK